MFNIVETGRDAFNQYELIEPRLTLVATWLDTKQLRMLLQKVRCKNFICM